MAEASPIGSPATDVAARPIEAKKEVLRIAPLKAKASKKPNVTWRYALRDDSVKAVPGQYHTKTGADHYTGEVGGYYRDEGRRWDDSYINAGVRRYLNW